MRDLPTPPNDYPTNEQARGEGAEDARGGARPAAGHGRHRTHRPRQRDEVRRVQAVPRTVPGVVLPRRMDRLLQEFQVLRSNVWFVTPRVSEPELH